MTDMFVRDIEQGIADTGIKAAILKCATDEPGVTPGVERVLRAVAQAHRRTGVPISTHTHAGTRRGLEQQRIFAEEGVDLSRVVIGHSRRHHRSRLPRGTHRQRLLHRHGPVRRRRVSSRSRTESTPWRECASAGTPTRWCSPTTPPAISTALPEETLPVAMPNWHYLHIHNDVIPALKERGVTDEQLTTMLVDNPRKIFESQGGY